MWYRFLMTYRPCMDTSKNLFTEDSEILRLVAYDERIKPIKIFTKGNAIFNLLKLLQKPDLWLWNFTTFYICIKLPKLVSLCGGLNKFVSVFDNVSLKFYLIVYITFQRLVLLKYIWNSYNWFVLDVQILPQ